VTISLDDETALWARVEAARRDTSLSKFVGEVLRRSRLEEQDYQRASRSFRGRSAGSLGDGSRYPTRDELHER
jgi:hypothetical protein